MTKPTISVTKLYEQSLVERGYKADAAQLKGIAALQRCQDEWSVYKGQRSNALTKMLRYPVLPKGVYMYGGVGRGKSFIMDCFFNAVPLQRKTRLHFHEFMREVHRQLHELKGVQDPLEVLAKRMARKHRLICFDEFHVADVTDAMILHRLLDAMFRNRMSIVTTSNFHPDELYPNGLHRDRILPAIELLKTHTRVFELDGGVDYRLRELTEAGVYFVGPGGTQRLAEHYDHLTGGHGVADAQFTVNGRAFPARRVGPDVVWFDFQDLCGTPRSVSDYIEIAREFHTVLLSGVPIFTHQHEPAARRFVLLIDEFYDRRVKLIIAADAPVTDLYAGGFVDFPFERIQSRLIEMQSVAYLAAPGAE